MQLFVAKSLVGDIEPSTMYLNDPACTGRNYNVTHYVIGTSYDMCHTSMQVKPTKNPSLIPAYFY